MTSIDLLNKALEVAGAVGGVMTALGAVLPAGWSFTKFCAKYGADVRGLHASKG